MAPMLEARDPDPEPTRAEPAAAAVTEHDGLPRPRRYWAIAAISFGTALLVLDGAVANVALPTIARDLGVSNAAVTNVVTVYQLVLVMVLVLIVRASRWTRVPVLYPAVFLVMLFVSCALEVSFGFVDRGFLLSVTVIPVAFIAFGTEPAPAEDLSEPGRRRPRSLRPAPATPARSTAAPGASTAGRSPQPLRR